MMTRLARLGWLGLVAMLVFLAVDADARRGGGGRGGGGGGGRSISRSSPARSGSFNPSRVRSAPSARSSSPARARDRSYTRPASAQTRPARPSGGQAAQRPAQPSTRPDRPTQRPERPADGSNRPSDADREDWQQHREDMQQDRQDAAKKRQEDRQEWGDNQLDDLEEGDWGEVDWDEAEGIYVIGDDEIEWGGADFMAFAVGTTLTVAAIESLTTGSEPACTLRSVVVGGETYYNCGPTWYVKTYTNGELAYAVVAPPPGY